MDQRIRELQRRWQTTGDREVELQYLVARLRAGDLSWGAIACAAYLGDEVCQGLLGEERLACLPPAQGLKPFVVSLPTPDVEVDVRLGVVLLEAQAHRLRSGRPALRGALDAVKAWTDCPCDEHRAAVAATLVRLLAAPVEPKELRRDVRRLVEYVATDDPDVSPPRGEGFEPRQQEALRGQIANELLPWVLLRTPPRRAAVSAYTDDGVFLPAIADLLAEERLSTEFRTARLLGPDPDELDAPLSPDAAHELLERLGPLGNGGPFTRDQAQQVVRTLLEVRGWRARVRGTLEAPSGRRRVRLQPHLLKLMVRTPGAGWRVRPTFQDIHVDRAAEALLASARAVLAGAPPAPSPSRARAAGPAPAPRRSAPRRAASGRRGAQR